MGVGVCPPAAEFLERLGHLVRQEAHVLQLLLHQPLRLRRLCRLLHLGAAAGLGGDGGGVRRFERRRVRACQVAVPSAMHVADPALSAEPCVAQLHA